MPRLSRELTAKHVAETHRSRGLALSSQVGEATGNQEPPQPSGRAERSAVRQFPEGGETVLLVEGNVERAAQPFRGEIQPNDATELPAVRSFRGLLHPDVRRVVARVVVDTGSRRAIAHGTRRECRVVGGFDLLA